jgi:hypothetical protein
MVILRANEEWRNDPERRKAAKELCTFRTLHISKLLQALREAKEESHLLHHSGFTEVPTLGSMIESLERSHLHYAAPTETLIGNMAAFGEGS